MTRPWTRTTATGRGELHRAESPVAGAGSVRLLRHRRRRECVHGARRDLHLRRRGNRELLSGRANVRARRRDGRRRRTLSIGRLTASCTRRGRWHDADRHHRARRAGAPLAGLTANARSRIRPTARLDHAIDGARGPAPATFAATPTPSPASGIWSSNCRAADERLFRSQNRVVLQ